ncbi:MAG: hypothetical protein J6A01_10185 [Proteobacteria bacterium]|nr:hypothetical protein [Pseudomonadota bacterium]
MRHLVLVIALAVLGLGIHVNAFAQEAENEGGWVKTDSHEYHWNGKPQKDYRFELGVGSGLSFIVPILHLSFQYRFSSFYRMGLEEKIGGIYWLMSQTLWTHEFDIYRGSLFNFSIRTGVGYWLQYFGSDNNPDYVVHRDRLNALNIPVGVGFAWRLLDDLSLKLTLEYDNVIVVYERYSDYFRFHNYPDVDKSRTEYVVSYAPWFDVMFTVVFHL